MKTLYFDLSSGISGNMTLGALLEILGDEKFFLEELNKLNVDGYKIEISKKVKNGITGTYVDVILDEVENHEHVQHHEEEHEHHHDEEHDHHHHHMHRNLFDVEKIIDESNLDEKVKELSKKIFLRVAKAESKVHNKPLDEIHFHEVGAIDSIVDIIGTAILINKINPDRIVSSIVNDGYGFIECAHGKMSVPVPATTEILAACNAICRQIDENTELVTPTGAAIIAELSENYGMMPEMKVEKIGWGSGYKDLTIPNVLKVYLGEEKKEQDSVYVIETNIDDSCGEVLGFAEEKLFSNGALDVFFTPIYMKKNRPAYRMTTVCKKEDFEKIKNIIFEETTTIGFRYRIENRVCLDRVLTEVDTKYGKIKVKKVFNGDEEFIYPEYESIKEVALKNNVPLKELYKLFK